MNNTKQIAIVQETIFGDAVAIGQQEMIMAFVDFARSMATSSRYQFVADQIEDDELKGEGAMFRIAEAFWMEAQRYIPVINTLIITNADARNEKAIADLKAFCDQRLAA